jgi:hypothetical protein
MIQSEHPSNTDVKQLQELIVEMAIAIERLSDDMFTKCVVASVFEDRSVEATLLDLKALNAAERPEYLFVANPDAPSLTVVHRSKEKHPEAESPERSSDQTT